MIVPYAVALHLALPDVEHGAGFGAAALVGMLGPQDDHAGALLIRDLGAAVGHEMHAAQGALVPGSGRADALPASSSTLYGSVLLGAVFSGAVNGGARFIPVVRVPSLYR